MIGTPPPNLPNHVASMMRLIEDAAVENFRHAMSIGRVIIITNSSCLWVPFTAKRFFPKLSQIIENGFEVYSARPVQAETAGPNYVYLPSMAVTWKTDKFREMLGPVEYPTCVSIGDGFAERCAVLAIASHKMSGKAVRFPLQPNGAVLLEQLKIMIQNLKEVVIDSRTGDLYLNTSTGGYRIIPVSGTTEAPIALPQSSNTATTTTSRISEKISLENASGVGANPGIMQALASGIAYYGRSFGNRMSISSSGSIGKPVGAGEQKPAVWTAVSSNVQDENASSESIRVEITNTRSENTMTARRL